MCLFSVLNGAKNDMFGPPSVPFHVREWSTYELINVVKYADLYPVFITEICSGIDKCKSHFDPYSKQPLYQTQILVLENTINVKKHLLTRSYFLHSFSIIVFINVKKDTNPQLLKKNCELWIREKARMIIFLPRNSSLHSCHDKAVETYNSNSIESTISRVVKNSKQTDWFLIQEANEIVTIPPNIAKSFTSIRDFILKATEDGQNFNAISVSTLYMTDFEGISYKGMPFKVHSEGPWDTWKNDKNKTLKPKVNTRKGTVKLWKKMNNEYKIIFQKCKGGMLIFYEVVFQNMNIYPYTLISMRYKPESFVNMNELGILPEKVHLMYSYYLFTGYWNFARKAMFEKETLY